MDNRKTKEQIQEKNNQAGNLSSQLWAMANDLRGKMDASEFRDYILGFIFIGIFLIGRNIILRVLGQLMLKKKKVLMMPILGVLSVKE